MCNDLHTFCDVTNFSSGVFEHRLKREADIRSKGWASLISSEFTDRPHPLVLNYTKKLNKKKNHTSDAGVYLSYGNNRVPNP